VLRHGAQLSGITCILLGWDAARRGLVSQLRALGLPVTVFAIAPAVSIAPAPSEPAVIHLRPGQIEADLARLIQPAGPKVAGPRVAAAGA
jgi:hypothetical protein